MTLFAVRGIQLNVEDCGAGEPGATPVRGYPGPPLLLLHGFTGSAATWEFLRSIPYRLVTVDLPGHGQSESPDNLERYRMDQTVTDLLAILDSLHLERVHLLGYSMGGRVALHLALAAPGRIQSLILESASPGIEDQAEREARIRSDEALARLLDREGLEPFIDRWERIPLFASQARLSTDAQAALREQRLMGSATGLANSLRGAGAGQPVSSTGQQESLWDRLDGLTMPALLLAGALDEKYRAIVARMSTMMPRAEVVIVPEAGHAVHLEAPLVVEREVVRFLGGKAPSPPAPLPQGARGGGCRTSHQKQALRLSNAIPAVGKGHPVPQIFPNQIPPLPWRERGLGGRSPCHKKRERQHMTIIEEQTQPVIWHNVRDYEDILYEKSEDGIAKITINRPEVRNAFRPKTLFELLDAFERAHEDNDVGVILFTGAGEKAFCSGGDQRVRGEGGYVDNEGVPRLNVLELQRTIRYLPKPVIAVVAGYAVGGGHVLHLVCDLTIAADNAVFGQTGPKVGSFDAGYGATLLARTVGQKKAKEIWFLCRQYDAQEALDMGLVNTVVPLDRLEDEAVQWAREILGKSPMALRFLKAAFNADTDGLAGLQQLAGDATLLYYMTDEAKEGKNAFLEKRKPDFSKHPRFP